MTPLPPPRGPLSEDVSTALLGSPVALEPRSAADDPLADEDLQLALYVLHELSYGGFDGVDDGWEVHPSVVSLRSSLESTFIAAVRASLPPVDLPPLEELSAWIIELSGAEGPPLARHLAREATIERFREFVIHRSAYTLKEADPHTFQIPRLRGRAKAALVEIQADEYGLGRVERMHSAIFATTMRAVGLDDRPNAYLDRIPGPTLATVNLVTTFGAARRWRGAAAGHLALFELTSAIPNREYGNGLRRLGFGTEATHYYDEHVVADSVHDMVAAYDLLGALVTDEPELLADVVFGARALDLLERRSAEHILGAWNEGRSSLREPTVVR